MALTPFQRRLCRLIGEHRLQSGEAYVAGGVALNELTGANRISRDIDLFHDTEAALQATWTADRSLFEQNGFNVRIVRQLPSLVEAEVHGGGEAVRIEWARDSAFRFFPLVTHPELGVTLHPVDLATNKLLALVGRAEIRDWIDIITSHEHIQPLGYLAWAACGKDPGFSPGSIVEHAARANRYSVEEVRTLAFDGEAPDATRLSRAWHRMLDDARLLVDALPSEHVGACVLTVDGRLCRAQPQELRLLESSSLLFHRGRIRGALPQLAD